LFAKNISEEARLKKMSKEDIVELDRLDAEDLAAEADEVFPSVGRTELPKSFTGHKFASEKNTPIAESLINRDKTLSIVPKGNNSRIQITTKDGFKADVEVKGGKLIVYTGDNDGGKGLAGKLYDTVWDAAEDIKKPYVPMDDLSFENQKRLTANMLNYIAKRKGKGNKFITIGKSQWGSKGLVGKPLTENNAKQLANNFIDEIEMNYLDESIKGMSDDAIAKVGKELGAEEHVRIGTKTLLMLRKYAKEGNFAAIVAAIGFTQEGED